MSAAVGCVVSIAAGLAVAVGLALHVRRLRREQRERDEAARVEAWAAANPHLVALAQRMGPVAAGLLAASYPDALLRRWHRETDGGRRG